MCALSVLLGNNFIFVKIKEKGATIQSYGLSKEAAIEYLTKVGTYGNKFKAGVRYSVYELTKVYHSAVIEDGGTELKEAIFYASKSRLVVPHKQFLVLKVQKHKAAKLFKAIFNY